MRADGGTASIANSTPSLRSVTVAMPKDFLKDARDEYDVVVIGSGLAGLTAANILARGGAVGAAARAALQARRHGHLVQAAGRAHLRYLAARLSVRHGQKLPPVLDAGDRRLDRAAEEHPVRQPDVLAHDVVQPRRLHAAADRTISRSTRRPCNGVLRHRPRDEFLRRPVDDDARAVRAVLSRPRGRDPAADGADHLRQRLHARRPGDQLRHRVLELHVEGRVHVRRRHRPADRADGGRAA